MLTRIFEEEIRKMLEVVPHGNQFAIKDTETGKLVGPDGGGSYTRDSLDAIGWLKKILEVKASTPKAQGHISIENFPMGFGLISHWNAPVFMKGDFQVVHGEDGRVWININGICFLRFKPE